MVHRSPNHLGHARLVRDVGFDAERGESFRFDQLGRLPGAEESLRAAESRIADADIAQEVTELATARILEQAAIAVLAQSIEQDKLVLELLEPAT